MNIHDMAHQLARSLTKSAEYQEFLVAKKKLDQNKTAKNMLKDLRAKQWEIQQVQFAGKQPSEQQMKSFKQVAELVSHNSALQEYLRAEYRFGQLMGDVQKILGDAVREWLPAEDDMPVKK